MKKIKKSEMLKILKIVYPIVVVVVGFTLSYVFYVLKLRGVLEFFVYSLIILLMIIVGRKIYHKS
ncbi:ABC transporter ATP-binding protein [Lachnoanaerobaculum gingivalis]|nr:ABC transporter ATP-binding protein [Lachnoanaerobaculum gingivalis]WHE87193.1 ABC transporter ATP-binding protein [Lachnoanaerobaculum gingivalis]